MKGVFLGGAGFKTILESLCIFKQKFEEKKRLIKEQADLDDRFQESMFRQV